MSLPAGEARQSHAPMSLKPPAFGPLVRSKATKLPPPCAIQMKAALYDGRNTDHPFGHTNRGCRFTNVAHRAGIGGRTNYSERDRYSPRTAAEVGAISDWLDSAGPDRACRVSGSPVELAHKSRSSAGDDRGSACAGLFMEGPVSTGVGCSDRTIPDMGRHGRGRTNNLREEHNPSHDRRKIRSGSRSKSADPRYDVQQRWQGHALVYGDTRRGFDGYYFFLSSFFDPDDVPLFPVEREERSPRFSRPGKGRWWWIETLSFTAPKPDCFRTVTKLKSGILGPDRPGLGTLFSVRVGPGDFGLSFTSFLIGCLDAPMMEGAGESGNRFSRCALLLTGGLA